MVRLTKIFDLLGLDTNISLIFNGENEYTGDCGSCPRETWCCAYADSLKFDVKSARYIIGIRYI